jgi:hypothetical protein
MQPHQSALNDQKNTIPNKNLTIQYYKSRLHAPVSRIIKTDKK